jgi:NAD(P)-dependent dehydrogenase (short-subunit alcohol dehydrogenase family)
MVSVEGKVAVVTGCSASRGIGWAVAETLAEHGAKVVVGSRTLEPVLTLAEKIGGTGARCDVSSEADVAAMAQLALSTYGRLDIAVNSAGSPVVGRIDDAERDAMITTIENNYFANVYFIKHMARAIESDGSIIIFSAMGSTHPMVPLFSYGCAKAATDSLVRYAALEYGPRQIRINSVLPGPVKTGMTHELYQDPAYEAALAREVPLGRVGVPSDYTDTVLWLADAYVTGLNLAVCGGLQLTRLPYEDELPEAADTFPEPVL